MESRIPDTREEAREFVTSWGLSGVVIPNPADAALGEFIRDIQYRTLMGAADDIRGNIPNSTSWVAYLRVAGLALSVKEGQK